MSPIRSWVLGCAIALLPAAGGAAGLDPAPRPAAAGQQLALLSLDGPDYRVRIPNFHPAFEFYRVTDAPGAGLCAVLASTRGYLRDEYGGAARTAFALVRAHLSEEYGQANEFTDTLRPASYWKAPNEWSRALYLKDRVYQAEWHAPPGNTLPGNVTHIVLAVQAMDTSRPFMTLLYQFDEPVCRGVEPRTEPSRLLTTR